MNKFREAMEKFKSIGTIVHKAHLNKTYSFCKFSGSDIKVAKQEAILEFLKIVAVCKYRINVSDETRQTCSNKKNVNGYRKSQNKLVLCEMLLCPFGKEY